MTSTAGAPGAPAVDHRTRPTDESCSQWLGPKLRYCYAENTTRYVLGYRCRRHDVRLMAGLPDLPPSPGIPAYR